ncbi:MAG: hypothetical protein R6U50_16325 [Desulfobacterales bacterium]
MKKAVALAAALAMVGSIGAQSAWAGRVAKRQARQDVRIMRGVKSGELTRCEARHLIKQQRRIHRAKRWAWSDGHLTRKEKAGLRHLQDKTGRHIYRLKHNNHHRN